MKVAVLGLGEAGSIIAGDLARGGDEVHGYDPAPLPVIDGVHRHESPQAAVAGCPLVLSVTHASHARTLLDEIVGSLMVGVVYADLSTGSPGLKETMDGIVTRQGGLFADVALMSPVPGRGLAAPALASGRGAAQFADLINARGGKVEMIGERAGEAAARKLLRSVVMKGLAALLIESTEAATRYGLAEWFWNHLTEQLGTIDRALMDRLLQAGETHSGRRRQEMEAARDLLVELGVPAIMTSATIEHLRRLTDEGHAGSAHEPESNPPLDSGTATTS